MPTSRPPPCLITRSQPGASRTAEAVARQGWRPLVVPVAQVVALPPDPGPLVQGQAARAVLLTSAHAARLAPRELHSRTVLAVGAATAAAARAAGFIRVRSAEGDAAALAHMARTDPDITDGAIWVRGEQVAADLVALLAKDLIPVWPLIVYGMHPPDDLANQLAAAQAQGPGTILIHSPAGARAVIRAAPDGWQGWCAVALSPAAAAPLAAVADLPITCAASPDETALLAALGRPRP